jgi:outer membrane protein TolC
MKKFLHVMRGLGVMVFFIQPAAGVTLDLEGYRAQVKDAQPLYRAAEQQEQAGQWKLREQDFITTPYLFGSLRADWDKSEQLDALLYGEQRRQTQGAVGLEQQTLFGLSWRLIHEMTFQEVEGGSPLFLPWGAWHSGRSGMELSQDLWRNAFGNEQRATALAITAQHRAAIYQAQFSQRQILVEAEMAYWRLAFAREIVSLQNRLLEDARRLEVWTSNQVKRQLMDAGDLYQVRSQAKQRELEWAAAESEALSACRAFNRARGRVSAEVEESIAGVGPAIPSGIVFTEKPPKRLDVLAEEEAAAAAEANARIQSETLAPRIQAQAGMYATGLDQALHAAWVEAVGGQHPQYGIGVNAQVPLDFFSRQQTQAGYALEAAAARGGWEAKKLSAHAEWQALKQEWEQLCRQYAIAAELADLQAAKLSHEKERLRRGKSFMFQVLQFEQDAGKSELAKMQLAQALQLALSRRALWEAEP